MAPRRGCRRWAAHAVVILRREVVMRGESHPDVEYVVEAEQAERAYGTFDEALSYAFSVALSAGTTKLDVVVYSEEGAEAFGGDDAVEEYREDPDASVFRRFEVEVRDLGRVP